MSYDILQPPPLFQPVSPDWGMGPRVLYTNAFEGTQNTEVDQHEENPVDPADRLAAILDGALNEYINHINQDPFNHFEMAYSRRKIYEEMLEYDGIAIQTTYEYFALNELLDKIFNGGALVDPANVQVLLEIVDDIDSLLAEYGVTSESGEILYLEELANILAPALETAIDDGEILGITSDDLDYLSTGGDLENAVSILLKLAGGDVNNRDEVVAQLAERYNPASTKGEMDALLSLIDHRTKFEVENGKIVAGEYPRNAYLGAVILANYGPEEIAGLRIAAQVDGTYPKDTIDSSYIVPSGDRYLSQDEYEQIIWNLERIFYGNEVDLKPIPGDVNFISLASHPGFQEYYEVIQRRNETIPTSFVEGLGFQLEGYDITAHPGFKNEGYQLPSQGKASVEAFPLGSSLGLIAVLLALLAIAALRKKNPPTKFS